MLLLWLSFSLLFLNKNVNEAHAAWSVEDPGVHRIAFGSCNNAERQGLWGTILAANPHALVLLGDNIYADRKLGLYKNYDFVFGSRFLPARESDFQRQYMLLAEDPQFQRLVSHIGGMRKGDGNIRATYDDHDYGINNGDRTFEMKEAAQRHFLDWLEVPATSERRSRLGVYNSHTFRVTLPVPSADRTAAGVNSSLNNASMASTCLSNPDSSECVSSSSSATGVPFTYKVILLDGRTHKDPKPGTRAAVDHARDADRPKSFLRKPQHTSSNSASSLRENLDSTEIIEDPAGNLGDFLGEEQWAWLAHELLDPEPVDLILLGTGVQVLPEDKVLEETWWEFPHARRRLLNMLRYARHVAGQAPILLLSGDVHTAEVLTGSWRCSEGDSSPSTADVWDESVWEFTSSGLTHTFVKQTPLRDDIDHTVSPTAVHTSVTSDIAPAAEVSSTGPEPIFTVLPALDDLPSPQEAAEALSQRLLELELALQRLLSPDDEVPAAPSTVAAAATTGIIETADPVQSVWEEAIKLLDQLQAHAQEQVQVQGELVSELLNHLQEALNGNSATVGGMLQEHSANETVSDGWEIWARSHAEHLSAAADAAVQVLELLRPPDATQEVAAATAIGEAFMSLFDDADNFASNALADGATYGEGSSPQTGATAAAPTAPSHTATSNYSTYPFPFTAQLSRGVFYEQVYDSFVATGASFARQHRWADHYEGLHYGTVDVRATAPGTAGGRSGRADVDIDIEVTLLDNCNRPIIRRVLTALPLSHFGRLNRDNAASVADMMAHWDALPNEPLTTTMQPIVQAAARHACDFLPFHGHTPAWRKRVAKWGLLAMPFLGLLVPVVTLAVLLCRAAWELTGACWDGLLDTASADEPPAEDADDQPLPRSPKSLSPTAPELPAPAPARKGGARRRPPR